MKFRRKWVVLGVALVLVILLAVMAADLWSTTDPMEAKVRQLLDEARQDRIFLDWWLFKLGLTGFRNPADVAGDLAALGPDAVPHLIEGLEDSDRGTRSCAATALARIGPEAVPALIDALQHKDIHVRCEAAWALGSLGPQAKTGVPALIRLLKGDGAMHFAAEALYEIVPGDPTPVPLLLDMVRRYRGEEARLARNVLSRIGRASVPALRRALEDQNHRVRAAAAKAIGAAGPQAEEAVPELTQALQDTDSNVREYAAEALGAIGPAGKGGVPALREALKDTDADFRLIAATALGRIGPAAKDATAALKEALKDESESVRQAAATALKKIQAAPATRKAAE
ncbi:MAG: HEAT repeat domain-containing protein [Phycisphaerae bacterium]|nr:HEAT repeat domain-containing protein [Phycisphaerae bacterium]